eukprot:3940826-Rhodomonas_salina.5
MPLNSPSSESHYVLQAAQWLAVFGCSGAAFAVCQDEAWDNLCNVKIYPMFGTSISESGAIRLCKTHAMTKPIRCPVLTYMRLGLSHYLMLVADICWSGSLRLSDAGC